MKWKEYLDIEIHLMDKKIQKKNETILNQNKFISELQKEISANLKRFSWCENVESRWRKYDTKIKNLQKRLKEYENN